jgi:hypothetical protein
MTETKDRMPDGLSNSISSFLRRTDHLRDSLNETIPHKLEVFFHHTVLEIGGRRKASILYAEKKIIL